MKLLIASLIKASTSEQPGDMQEAIALSSIAVYCSGGLQDIVTLPPLPNITAGMIGEGTKINISGLSHFAARVSYDQLHLIVPFLKLVAGSLQVLGIKGEGPRPNLNEAEIQWPNMPRLLQLHVPSHNFFEVNVKSLYKSAQNLEVLHARVRGGCVDDFSSLLRNPRQFPSAASLRKLVVKLIRDKFDVHHPEVQTLVGLAGANRWELEVNCMRKNKCGYLPIIPQGLTAELGWSPYQDEIFSLGLEQS